MLYSYGRFLLPHLPQDCDDTVVNIGNEVELQYYRLQRVSSGSIYLASPRLSMVRPMWGRARPRK